jgi:alkylation response protein AidB-like acyl-CoA dehydrogenase
MPAQSPAGTFPEYPTLLRKPLSEREVRLLERARGHAADFAPRADAHDRDNSFPHENYEEMKRSGYAHMTMPEAYGGEDVNLLELCGCQEQLAQGCAGTAIGANMHIFGVGARLFDLQFETPERRAQGELMMKMLQTKGIPWSFSETGVGACILPQTTVSKTEGGCDQRPQVLLERPAADMIGVRSRRGRSGEGPRGDGDGPEERAGRHLHGGPS